MKLPRISPGRWLLAGVLLCAIAGIVTSRLAVSSPWLGLELRADPTDKTVRVVAARGPSSRDVPVPSVLVSIGASGMDPMALEVTDLVDEPDSFDQYGAMATFFARQSELERRLRGGAVTLELKRPDGVMVAVSVTPLQGRPFATLPTAFWFQIAAGSVAFLVGLWVLVLRPHVVGVRMFALTGVTMLTFTEAAAVYSTRELALSGHTFRVLSGLNHLGAMLFGVGLVGLFLSFPKALVRPRLLWLLPAVFVPWWALDFAHVAPNQSAGHHGPIMLQMLAAIVLAVLQWRATRSDARARASLRWFGVCVLAGCSLFVFNVVGASLLSAAPPIEQAYSFGFFLLMHVGIALGLRQTRLFELNELSYIVLAWAVGAIALVAVDGVVLYALGTSPAISSAIALSIVGFSYLPARSWLWSKVFTRRQIDEHVLFPRVLDVVFAIEAEERERRWRALFDTVFAPLEITVADPKETTVVALEEDGLRMAVPQLGSLPALRIAYPWRGRGLFGVRHTKLVAALLQVAEHAETTRNAFDRGVRDERARVARDLHDDIGARLASGLFQEDPEQMRHTMKSAILEMRSMVNELTGRRLRLSDVIGDLRHETQQRLGDAGLASAWPLVDLGAVTIHSRIARSYMSMMREITSNVIRHAQATTMTVDTTLQDDELSTTVGDDGIGFEGEEKEAGNGLRNLRRRAQEAGGTIRFLRRDKGTRIEIVMPLQPRDTAVSSAADVSPVA